jgi:hypothetical protein
MLLGVNTPQQPGLSQVSHAQSMLPKFFSQSFPHPSGTLIACCLGEIYLDIHFFTDSITNTKKITTDFML